MLARYLYFHVEAELDADLASDLVFAEYVSEEKNPVPTGWCYSTDLRVLNTQLIFAPLFYLIQNWHMIRVVGTLLCLADYDRILCMACIQFGSVLFSCDGSFVSVPAF